MRRFAATLAGLGAIAGLVAAHLALARRGGGYTGVLLILDHLFSITLVLGMVAIAAGVGGRLLKAGGLRLERSLEALLFGTVVGLGTLATAIFVVGCWSVRPVVLLAVLAGAAFIGRNELRQLPLLVKDVLACLRARADRLSLSVFCVIALVVITGALTPPTDWDALMYHLRVPQQFLEHGSIYLTEDNAHWAFVSLPHMLYLPLLALGTPAGPALVSALCTLALALATFAFALRFLDQRTAGLSLAVLWGSGMLVLVAISPRIDTILALYLFLVHYAVICAMEAKDARLLYLSAALAGMAVGVKYNALVYLLALAPLGGWVVIVRLQKRAGVVALVLGLALVTALPWLLKNALFLGDPLYPFLRGFRLDPWLARIYGGPALPPQVDPGAVLQVAKPFNLVDLFVAPERITVEGEGAFYRPNLLLLVLPLWLLCLKTEVLTWLAGPAIAYVALVVLLQPTTSLRYLSPVIPSLTLVALHAYGQVWDRVLPARWVQRLLAATTLLVLVGTGHLSYLLATNGRHLAYASGALSRDAFLKARTRDYGDVVGFVNERLPKQSLILMLLEGRGYYFRVPVLQDNVIMNWPLLSTKAAWPDCLRSVGITHVLLNVGAIQYYALRGVDLAPLRLRALRRFTDQCLNPIHVAGGFRLFEVRPATAKQ